MKAKAIKVSVKENKDLVRKRMTMITSLEKNTARKFLKRWANAKLIFFFLRSFYCLQRIQGETILKLSSELRRFRKSGTNAKLEGKRMTMFLASKTKKINLSFKLFFIK